jgi:hypothetical protein
MKNGKTDVSMNYLVNVDTHENNIDSTRWPTRWPPKYWPKGAKRVERPLLLTLPDKRYISDPIFDGMYSMKSSMGCLFGAIQCVSVIVISCIRLHNIDTMHTMDVLSMFTCYLLLCIVIIVACDPSYYCKPVVCIPENKLEIYSKINDGLSFPELRLRVHSFFDEDDWGPILVLLLLLIPIFLMAVLLIYINKNDMLLLTLSTVSILFVTTIGPLTKLLEYPFLLIFLFQAIITLGLFIALVIFSCLNATPEQKYPSNVNWLPHF